MNKRGALVLDSSKFTQVSYTFGKPCPTSSGFLLCQHHGSPFRFASIMESPVWILHSYLLLTKCVCFFPLCSPSSDSVTHVLSPSTITLHGCIFSCNKLTDCWWLVFNIPNSRAIWPEPARLGLGGAQDNPGHWPRGGRYDPTRAEVPAQPRWDPGLCRCCPLL